MRWAEAWRDVEASRPAAHHIRRLVTMPWREFEAQVWSEEQEFVQTTVASLHDGDAWLLKGAFPREFMFDLRERTVAWTRAHEESFHKMVEGCPDFHRRIDFETGKKYSILACKHSAYFYRWNGDPLRCWGPIDARWRIAKMVMGLRSDEYVDNTPKDGVVDRVQVVRYPPAIGYLEPHQDAHEHQRCFLSGYMSKRGVDYQGGGFYFVSEFGRASYVENRIDIGDICLGHASLYHGVAPCDRDDTPDWNGTDGRWFLSMYSNASDEMPKRHTAKPVRIRVPGVLP